MCTDPKVWASQASHMIGEYYDATSFLIDREEKLLSEMPHFLSAQLFLDCHLSSESILLLIGLGKEWDADLINRAVIEGSLKLTYMLQGTEEEIEEKANQYWNILPLFHQIRHSENAKKILDTVSDRNSPEWLPFYNLISSDAEVEAIRAKYPKAARKALEEQWSFVGLCRALVKPDEPGSNMIAGVAHGYAMSSHLLHKDADGIGVVWDRSQRSEERRQAVTLSHVARIVSDVCAFAKLRAFSVFKACKIGTEKFSDIDKKYEALELALEQAHSKFRDVEYDVKGENR